MATVLLILGLTLAALTLHPFVTYPLSLALLARLKPRSVSGGAPSDLAGRKVALCICAYNEARVIRATIDNKLELRRVLPKLEILVYVDASSDNTADILREYGDEIRLVVSSERHGKTHGMNRLVGMTDAEFVVFTDANVVFTPDTIPRLLRPFADLEVGCVGGKLTYVDAATTPTAAAGSLYWRMDQRIKELESRTGSIMGAAGAIFAVRRSLHRAPPPDIIEDLYVSLAVLCEGHRVVFAPDAVGYEEMVSRPAEEFRRRIRIACQSVNVHRLLRPRLAALSALDRYKYVSHKMMRWMTVYLLGASAVCTALGLALAGAWAVLAVLLASGLAVPLAARLRPQGLAAKLFAVANSFVATGIGVWRSLRGQRFQTWSPAASGRSRAVAQR
jgi:cellulose synthase/poly-beta-1,6-N-acetylglucosamine synthase-like glycosyltransferase